MQDDLETPLFQRAWTERGPYGTCRMRVQIFDLSVRLSRLKRRAPSGDVEWETLCEAYRKRPGAPFHLEGVAQVLRDVLAEQLFRAGEREAAPVSEIVGVRLEDLLRDPPWPRHHDATRSRATVDRDLAGALG